MQIDVPVAEMMSSTPQACPGSGESQQNLVERSAPVPTQMLGLLVVLYSEMFPRSRDGVVKFISFSHDHRVLHSFETLFRQIVW